MAMNLRLKFAHERLLPELDPDRSRGPAKSDIANNDPETQGEDTRKRFGRLGYLLLWKRGNNVE